MNRKRSLKQSLPLPILVIAVTLVLLAFGSDRLTTPNIYYSAQLDEGWSVRYGENQAENVTLSDFYFENLKTGDVITISNTFKDEPMYAPTIMFRSNESTVQARVDDTTYSYGQEYLEHNKFIPKKYHLLTFYDNRDIHEVEITYTLTEDEPFRVINPIFYGNRNELIRNFFQRNRLPIFTGSFLSMYACLLLCLGSYLFLYHGKDLTIFYSAFMAALFGFYVFAYNDIFCFVSDRDYILTLGEYIALYFIPFATCLLLYSVYPNMAPLRQRSLLALTLGMPLMFIALHIADVVHISHFVIINQLILLVQMVLILPPLVKESSQRHRQKKESPTYIGVDADVYPARAFIILYFFGFMEVVKYNLIRRLGGAFKRFDNVDFLAIGALFFVVCLFIFYFFSGIEHINARIVKERLEGLAYTDGLTNLMNRAKCMQYVASVTGPYAVVSLDLDRLKFINDTFGHIEGDKMLKTFAGILEKAFEGAAVIGRTGGDEFMVVYRDPSENVCKEAVDKLQQLTAEFNDKKSERFTLSASAGYAYSSEISGGFEEVYYLADTRMYEMKDKHHA